MQHFKYEVAWLEPGRNVATTYAAFSTKADALRYAAATAKRNPQNDWAVYDVGGARIGDCLARYSAGQKLIVVRAVSDMLAARRAPGGWDK